MTLYGLPKEKEKAAVEPIGDDCRRAPMPEPHREPAVVAVVDDGGEIRVEKAELLERVLNSQFLVLNFGQTRLGSGKKRRRT